MSLITELVRRTGPDEIGRDLALLRTRLYRFSDDQRNYALVETLEERFLAGHRPGPVTVDYTQECLDAIRRTGRPLPFPAEVATAEGFDIDAEVAHRQRFTYHNALSTRPPQRVIAVVGAPRSGTSHLVNLLARERHFAYLTTASCWAWPVRNLHQPTRRLLTDLTDAEARTVLGVDNKRTRVVPGLMMPGEAEDVYARALPVYRHHHGHRYEVIQCEIRDLDVLNGVFGAHLEFFRKPFLLTKSPFNCFRISQLEAMWEKTVHYIHIVREQHETAESMRRNHFEYLCSGALLSAEEAHTLFVSAVNEHAPPSRLLTLTHQALLRQPRRTVLHVLKWLGVVHSPETSV